MRKVITSKQKLNVIGKSGAYMDRGDYVHRTELTAPVSKPLIGAVTTGANSITEPVHNAGDLLICFEVNDNSSTNPGLPAGYTDWNKRSTAAVVGVLSTKIGTGTPVTFPSLVATTQVLIVAVSSGSADNSDYNTGLSLDATFASLAILTELSLSMKFLAANTLADVPAAVMGAGWVNLANVDSPTLRVWYNTTIGETVGAKPTVNIEISSAVNRNWVAINANIAPV